MPYNVDFEVILITIRDYDDTTERTFNENKYEAITEYIVNWDYEMRELVYDYGIFKALKLYQDSIGNFEVKESTYANYLMLGDKIMSSF